MWVNLTPPVSHMAARSLYLPDALEALLEHEAHARGVNPGVLAVRMLADVLAGTESPTEAGTRKVVDALRDYSTVEEVAKFANVPEAFAHCTLQSLAALRPLGRRDGPGLVTLEDRDGVAHWSLTVFPSVVPSAA